MDSINVKLTCPQAKEADSVVLAVESNECVVSVKHHILRAWPVRWPRARAPSDLRLICMGAELRDDEALSAVRDRAKSDPLAIHLVVRERSASAPGTPTVHYPSSPVRQQPQRTIPQPNFEVPPPSPGPSVLPHVQSEEGSAAPTVEADPHFHAVTVTDREFVEFRQIFDRKKGADGRIACNTVRLVLQSYWRFIHREGFEVATKERAQFPEHRLEQLQRKVGVMREGGMSLDQFLTVFYLFDNEAAEEPCIHGERERVRIATAQLHALLQMNHDFYHERFEELFSMICSDQNGQTLTCKEMELLYYMYSVFVLDKLREEELVSKVQAIVRMRIQSNKYNQLVDAARTVQSAWRVRMFASDRTNHERIAEFLRCMMHASSPSKLGGPRNF